MKKIFGLIGLLTIVLMQLVSAASIISVTSPNEDDRYTEGDNVLISVVFDDVVTVAPGSSYLELETGTVNRDATYLNGSGTNTLTYNYLVQSGDNSCDLDYVNANSFVLNGDAITDSGMNPANTVLPDAGFIDSLSYNKHIVIGNVNCGYTVPEFNFFALGLAIAAAGLGLALLRKN